MGLILHLSDLHLGKGGTSQTIDDLKRRIMTESERRTRIDVIRQRLDELRAKMDGKKFSAVVVTGDITVRNNEEGFNDFDGLLSSLRGSLPPNDRIVVVPGNHDVAWFTKPGSAERYERFTKYIADRGYTTPLLEGISLFPAGAPSLAGHFLYETDENWAVVPINSSNWCGVRDEFQHIDQATWKAVLEAAKAGGESAVREIESLTQHDVAQISREQLDAVKSIVERVRNEARRHRDAPLLIGALHHHLLPVGEAIEIKTFESITNLGEFRRRLARNKFNVVLHGHKHSASVFWDSIADGSTDSKTHEIMMISAPTLGGDAVGMNDPGRIIEVTPLPGGHSVTVRTINEFVADKPVTRGQSAKIFGGERLTEPNGEQCASVCARTFDEAYERVMALSAFSPEGSGIAYNLTVMIADAETVAPARKEGAKPPASYPGSVVQGSDQNVLDWFRETVEWWQDARITLPRDSYFTHGGRIRKYNGSHNQISEIAELLRLEFEPGNGRGVVSLLNPETDIRVERLDRGGGGGRGWKWFPAFCMAQIYITRRPDNKKALNIIGFFRKHEMRYWWPVNVSELAQILYEVRGELKGKHSPVELGSISTYATIAHAEVTKPRVAIPRIDMIHDTKRTEIFELVYALVMGKEGASIQKDRDRWMELLRDVVPEKPPPSDSAANVPLAQRGLEQIIEYIKLFAKRHPQIVELKELQAVVDGIRIRNVGFIQKGRSSMLEHEKEEALNELRSDNTVALEQVAHLLDKLLSR